MIYLYDDADTKFTLTLGVQPSLSYYQYRQNWSGTVTAEGLTIQDHCYLYNEAEIPEDFLILIKVLSSPARIPPAS